MQILRRRLARLDLRPLVHLNISIVTRDGDRIEAGGIGEGGRLEYDRWFDPAEWKKMADEALRKSLVNLEAIDAPAGEMTVVLGAGWPAVMLHEAIGHGLEGDFNRRKPRHAGAPWARRLHADGVFIVDDGTIGQRRGSLTIDDEGTPSQCTTLIENGVLVGYMQDRLACAADGHEADRQRKTRKFRAPALSAHDEHHHAFRHDDEGRHHRPGEKASMRPIWACESDIVGKFILTAGRYS